MKVQYFIDNFAVVMIYVKRNIGWK